MKHLRLRRPSPAMVVAVVALVSATVGPAIAQEAVDLAKTKKISGSRITSRSISGNKLKNNTLTGKQIAESKSGEGPDREERRQRDQRYECDECDECNECDERDQRFVNAANAVTADSAPPFAYAHIDSAGNLYASRTRNLTATKLGVGSMCFRVGQAPKNVTTAVENIFDRFVFAFRGSRRKFPAAVLPALMPLPAQSATEGAPSRTRLTTSHSTEAPVSRAVGHAIVRATMPR